MNLLWKLKAFRQKKYANLNSHFEGEAKQYFQTIILLTEILTKMLEKI